MQRADRACNFLDGGQLFGDDDVRIIYRHYATLYFVFVADAQESELGMLDLIQVFVETLDKCFENVCELNLIFHPDRVWYVLDEIIQGGMVLETRADAILPALAEQSKIEKEQSLGAGVKNLISSIRSK